MLEANRLLNAHATSVNTVKIRIDKNNLIGYNNSISVLFRKGGDGKPVGKRYASHFI